MLLGGAVMFRFKLLSVLAFIAVATSAFAITDEEIFRTFSFSFLNPGARSAAMGGAFIALADDATAAEANPAGLIILTRPEVTFEYRHTEVNPNELNFANIVADKDGFNVIIATDNSVEDQDQPSYVSVVFPAGSWTFGFSRQEVVKQDAIVSESILLPIFLQENGQTLTIDALLGSDGSVQQDIVNWNFAAGVKLSESFSLGATVRYSTLDWNTDVRNTVVIPDIPDLGTLDFSHTSINDDDKAWGFNVGALWKTQHASFGVVYKRNPKFEVTEVEEAPIVGIQSRSFANVLKVPDNFGGGVAVKPNDNLTITGDIVYIKFDQLNEDFEAGHNIFTLGYTNENLQYKVKNGVDYKIGTEFVVFVGNVPVALRAGYFRKASNSLLLDSFSNILPGDQVVLPKLFGIERDDTNHFTFGNGFVFGQHFQLDWAMDTSNLDDTFVLSSVVRF
jgi:long-chain fatty acid transport protein